MEGSAYPAPRRAELPRKPMIVAGLASVVLGFAAATTVGMLIDEDATTTTKTRVIVSEPVATGAGVAAKDEAAVAAAVGASSLSGLDGSASQYEADPSTSQATPTVGTRYDGGPEEGTRGLGR